MSAQKVLPFLRPSIGAVPSSLFAGITLSRRLQNATIEHTFPTQLNPGEEITGTITVTNNTDSDQTWAVHVIPQWAPDKETATSSVVIPAGGSYSFTFPTDFSPSENLPLKMPDETASLTIRVVDVNNEIQGEAVAVIEVPWYYKKYLGLPLWQIVLGAGALVVLILAFAKK